MEATPPAASVKELVKALGGTGAVATGLGVGAPAVSMWIARGVVPWRHHGALLKLAGAAGVALTLEWLSTINERRAA